MNGIPVIKRLDQPGYELLGVVKGSEKNLLAKYSPITAAMVLARFDGKIIVGYNRHRKNWELPAGRIGKGETVADCARRELYEESGQSAEGLQFAGLACLRRPSGETKFTAVYSTVLSKLKSFKENEEWSKIRLWDMDTPIGDYDHADFQIAECFRE